MRQVGDGQLDGPDRRRGRDLGHRPRLAHRSERTEPPPGRAARGRRSRVAAGLRGEPLLVLLGGVVDAILDRAQRRGQAALVVEMDGQRTKPPRA